MVLFLGFGFCVMSAKLMISARTRLVGHDRTFAHASGCIQVLRNTVT